MTKEQATSAAFRQRFIAGERLLGSFIKTPTSHGIEILGEVGYDFIVIDEEHAPFDRAAIDVALLAAQAAGIAGLVRVSSPATILGALDCGAVGVLVPHVVDAGMARQVADAARFRGGKRGYSPSGRSGGFGTKSLWPYVDQADKKIAVIAMIEDPRAVDNIAEIAAVDGIDGFFIGRGDLTIAFGAADQKSDPIISAVGRIAEAAKSAGKPVAVMVGSRAEADRFAEMGASTFIVSSDQAFLRRAASQALKEFQA
ncbi:MAG: HpcH/HpaI aldolase family protein [Phyllobacterium sp.]